ncbi:unnamed protein product [Diamesa tonsa]
MSAFNLKMSDYGRLTVNAMRAISERDVVAPNPDKEVITFQAGDPTKFGNFPPAPESIAAIERALKNDTFGYCHSAGMPESREAIVEYVKKINKEVVNADDVILTSGCSMALDMCIRVLTNPGDNVLIPRPCFHYKTWMMGSGVVVNFYNLDPAQDWNVDLKDLESRINNRTKAIILNSPGNPCGNVFSRSHILDILAIAEKHNIPIISDEVYEHCVFPGVEYNSVSSLSVNVPVFTCSGLTKRFLIPGIRMGWLIVHDKNNDLNEIRQGLLNIAGRNFGPNSTAQLALPDILKNTPQEFFDKSIEKVAQQAANAYNLLMEIPGLNPIMPKGSMYMMIGIDLKSFPDFSSCLDFTQGLIREQSVLTFPGDPCFEFPGFFRIVLTVPEDMIIESCSRIREFCGFHYTAVQLTEL